MIRKIAKIALASILALVMLPLAIPSAVSYVPSDETSTIINLTNNDIIANTLNQPTDWAEEEVYAAINGGLVPIHLQSNYTQDMTRAEYCALAVTLYEYVMGEITERMEFADTDDINVMKAGAIEVVGGIGDNMFAPDRQLRREEAATMLSRLANALGMPLAIVDASFSDMDDVSDFAINNVGQVQAAGIMGGVGGNRFAPQDPYTREQSIMTIYRLFRYIFSDENDISDGNDIEDRDTLYVHMNRIISSFDIEMLIYSDVYQAMQCIYEPLYIIHNDGGKEFFLVDYYEVMSPTNWQIHLRENVTFSNGNTFKANDVIHSLNVWSEIFPDFDQFQQVDLERTRALDDYTIDLYMIEYSYLFDFYLSTYLIFDEESWNESLELGFSNIMPIGTGPYVLTEFVPNSHISIERRDDYYRDQPEIKAICFRMMTDQEQIRDALATGMLDIARVQLADYDDISSIPELSIHALGKKDRTFINFNSGFNSAFSRFENPDAGLAARLAFFHAIDTQAIIGIVTNGLGFPMRSAFADTYPDYLPEYDNMHEAYATGYNPELARAYAEEAGLTGRTIRMITTGSARGLLQGELIQQMLHDVGITMEIVNVEFDTLVQMYNDPYAQWDFGVSYNAGPSCTFVTHLVYDIVNDTALSIPGAFPDNEWYMDNRMRMLNEYDPNTRLAITEEFMQIYLDNVISMGLYSVELYTAVSNNIDQNSIVLERSFDTILLSALRWN